MTSEPENLENAETGPDVPAVDEQLIAYLDGELDDEATRQVEQQLSSDPETRQSLGRLERTWNLLDGLERLDVDEVFTHSTLEMVATVAADEVQEKRDQAPRKQRRRRLIGSAVLLGAAAAGFLTVRLLWNDPNEQLLRNVQVLENLDEYREIQDIEFLRALHEAGLFPAEEEEEESDQGLTAR